MNAILKPRTTTVISLGIVTIAFLAAAPAARAAITVWNVNSGDFNAPGNWLNANGNPLPGEDGPINQQAVIQGSLDIATTSDDYTVADGDPINFDYALVVRSDAVLNIGHNLSTSATDSNTGTFFVGFDAGGGTINHSAGTVTTGTLFIGGIAANFTQTASYNITGGDIDANLIDIRAADFTRRGRLLVGGGVTLDEAININHGFAGSIESTGDGAALSGAITLNQNGDFRGGGNSLTFSGGITSAANQSLGLNLQAIIDTNPINLGTGSLGFTSTGILAAQAAELNVGGNTWDNTTLNFSARLKLGGTDFMPTGTDVFFGWSRGWNGSPTAGWSDGVLDLNSFDQTVASLNINGNSDGLGGNQFITDTTGSGTLTINKTSGTSEYQGRFEGGLSLVKDGAGTQILNNQSKSSAVSGILPSTFTGTTTINNGILEIQTTDALGSTAGATTVNNGGTLRLAHSGFVGDAITINGTGAGGIGAIQSTGANSDLSGVITLGSDATIRTDTRIDHSNQITDNGNGFTLTKIGANSFVTGSAANYSNLVINEGEFLVTTSVALPEGDGTTVTVNSGGQLTLWSDGPSFSDVRLTLNDGALYDANKNVAGANDIDGTITVNGDVTMRSWSMDHTVNSDISGSGNITLISIISNENDAKYTFAGDNNYSGTTTVGNAAAGVGKMTLEAGSTTGLSSSSAHTVTANSTLQLNTFSNTIGSLAGAGTVENGGGSAATLTTGGDNTSTTFSGTLQDGGAGALSLVKEGGGTMTLTGTNTYTGDTTVDGGILEIAANQAVANGDIVVNNGGTYSLNTGSFNALSGAVGSITINEGGTVSTDSASNNAHNILDPFFINGGTLTSSGGTFSGGNWIFNNTVTVGGSALSTISADSIANRGSTYEVADSVAGASTDLLISSNIVNAGSGTEALIKNGAGTMELTGTNTYTGLTDLNAGTLLVNGDSSGATSDVTVASGATLGGTGTIGGATTVFGDLEPGPVGDVGTLSFLDDLTLGGTTHIDLGATSDLVNVGGALAYGGALELHIGPGFDFGTYDLFDFASESGDFSSVSVVGDGIFTPESMGVWRLSVGNQSWLFRQSTGLLSVGIVPEPSSFALLLAGLAGLCLRRRRRKR